MGAWQERLSELPPIPLFLAVGMPVLLVLAALLFLGRRAGWLGFLRASLRRGLFLATTLALLLMVVLSFLQILLRNTLESGLLWIDPLLRHLVLLLTLFGALAATGGKRHLQINVLGRLLSGAASRTVGAATALLGSAICLALTHASLELLGEELQVSEVAFLNVPMWTVIAILPLSFGGMALRFALLVFEEATGMAPPPEAGEAMVHGANVS